MKELLVSIEINGTQVQIGKITGTSYDDACFCYTDSYLESSFATPISISLPLQHDPFSKELTRGYFEGLLPEGFSRKTVAEWLHEDEKDYIAILQALGRECLGAVQIKTKGDPIAESAYEKLSLKKVKELASEGASRSTEILVDTHLSLTGASGKVGLYTVDDGKNWYLPRGSAPSTHIVKQSHVRLSDIIINERLVLMTAGKLGIETVDSSIISTGDKDDSSILFSTKRYDRLLNDDCMNIDGMPCPKRLHQEDFAQALGIPSERKYEKRNEGYLSKMMDLIRRVSANPIEDQKKIWNIVVFNYLIGNTDSHIKNFSLLYDKDLQSIRLAPAYDLVSTIVYKESTRQMSFAIGGEYDIDHITMECFRTEAKSCHIGEHLAMSQFKDMKNSICEALHESAEELAEESYERALDIEKRIIEWRSKS